MPLKAFPKAFGLDELKTGYFPHYFNKECNKNYIGCLPAKRHYGYDQMRYDDRDKFVNWYEERINNNYIFDFKKELIEYCRSDVDILIKSIVRFREDFTKLENIDPMKYLTIAVVCMSIYRANYMPKK